MPRIAVVQYPSVLLDRRATLARAAEIVVEAGEHGAALVVFPETFIPGYPAWIWRLRPGTDMSLASELHERLVAESIDLSRDDLAPLRAAACGRGVTVVCGIHERDASHSRTTLYNTCVVIGEGGEIVNRHRKLVPTSAERMVWGPGDATGLRVVETPCGRAGTLICWESYMPLARFALYAQGIELYVAPTWDAGDGWIGTLQHIAREGRCWVVGAGSSLRASDIPETFPRRSELYPDLDEWLNPGDSVVIEPGGKIVAGPLRKEHGILYAEIDPSKVAVSRRSLDVAGHYARPDVLQLVVNESAPAPVVFRRRE